MKQENQHECICGRKSWDLIAWGLIIIALAVGVSAWQNDRRYLWLIALLAFTSSEECKATSHN